MPPGNRRTWNRDRTYDAIRDSGAAGVQAATIVQKTGIDRSTVLRNVKTLIEAGRAERFPDPHDGRTVRYRLTEGS